MDLTLENTERGLEIHDKKTGFVAEVVKTHEGQEIVDVYNSAQKLSLIEYQHFNETEWGLSSNGCNPTDTEFYPMPKETAIRLINYLQNN